MAKLSMFETTYHTMQSITRVFDMVWPIDAGLWHLKSDTLEYYSQHEDATDDELKAQFVSGLTIHGLNFKRLSQEFSWEEQEGFIAELLLINAMAIFDSWVDEIVETGLLNCSNNQKKTIKADLKKGEFNSFDVAISNEPLSSLNGCFYYRRGRQDAYINNWRLVYKYFKSCRNCCAHGNKIFTPIAETNYNAVATFRKEDLGINEVPKMAPTVQGQPVKLVLRGVVGLYDVINRIINHYDIALSERVCLEDELKKRWSYIPEQPVVLKANTTKRDRSIRNFLQSVNMYPSKSTHTDRVYNFLHSNNLAIVRL